VTGIFGRFDDNRHGFESGCEGSRIAYWDAGFWTYDEENGSVRA
jgi:hypothetical protein